ncbi:hypothetical protein GOP47_0002934 [Adiantum capillus-veneris]|uniref:Uncharacterized protein n=1 Tax=Adiantum capillus-veneris TaxID=13818 RepID=A0A9D4VB12_ADICA|nr:hypothetical protein GOP47_0002934 [Adiantum capillus-veneris]
MAKTTDEGRFYNPYADYQGAITGGSLGISDGLRAAEKDDTLKLRVNRVLNASGHRGRSYGNKLGIVGLLYAGMESTIVHYRGTDDMLNSIAAGLGTGAMFRVAAGPRAAAFAGAIGGLAAGAAVAGKHVFKRYLPI